MNKLIVLSGVPGSGKSYFSKTVKNVKNNHVYVVSSDELRREITGIQSNLSEDILMWKIFYSLAKTYSLDKEGVVILDATHVNSHLRVDKIRNMKKLFDEIYLVMWNIDRHVVSNQNLQRDFPIPPDILDKFYEIFEPPTQKDKDFFDKILIITSSDIASVINELNLQVSEGLPE